MKRTNLAIAALIGAIGVSSQASATPQSRSNVQAAVNNCLVAVPGFEGAFRKRPLGIANEGATTAFISCALSVEVESSSGITNLIAFFTNRGAATVDVTCTIVNNELSATIFTPTFVVKAQTIPAGSKRTLSWSSADNGGDTFAIPSLSCAIPAGAEINGTQTFFDGDIGP